jgi:hypothetical protein
VQRSALVRITGIEGSALRVERGRHTERRASTSAPNDAIAAVAAAPERHFFAAATIRLGAYRARARWLLWVVDGDSQAINRRRTAAQ